MLAGIAGHKALEVWYTDLCDKKLRDKPKKLRILRAVSKAESVFFAYLRDSRKYMTPEEVDEVNELQTTLIGVLHHYFPALR
jgi:hypothetical protein